MTMKAAGTRLILTLTSVALAAGQQMPPGLPRKVALRETESEAARANFTYRQNVLIEELDDLGARRGDYREVREVAFSPQAERTEQAVGKPRKNLVRLSLTEEDFRDIREVQPFLLTAEKLWLYEIRFKGEENIDAIDCYVLDVRPRQLLDGQRLFEGLFWVDKRDHSIIRGYGRAVPQIWSTKGENLFPRFTTVRKKMPNGFWFPDRTYADDILPFRNGPIRIRMSIQYDGYKQFKTDSKVTFEPLPPGSAR
jgi:hypothetical protein